MLVIGNSIFVWKLDNREQLDILNGTGVVGGAFTPNSSNFTTFGKDVIRWKIK